MQAESLGGKIEIREECKQRNRSRAWVISEVIGSARTDSLALGSETHAIWLALLPRDRNHTYSKRLDPALSP